MLCALGVVPSTPLIDAAIMRQTLTSVRDEWDWSSAWGWDFAVMAMTATRLGEPDIAVDALLMDAPKNTFSRAGHNVRRADDNPIVANILPIYLPGNGAVLAAVSMMVDTESDVDVPPGFPQDGSWVIRHEGFVPWP